MGSLSGLGIGLSFVFGCILMGLVAELYYLLWWKKRIITNIESTNRDMMEFSFLYCWKRPILSFNTSTTSSQELTTSVRNDEQNQDLEVGSKNYGENEIETELMRMHNLCGPPRFLFTIKEESKEDLESEEGRSKSSRKGSRTKSLSELVFAVDGNTGTPYLTPLSSPGVKTPPQSLEYYNNHGFNPLYESLSEAELNRLRSSPPPKFKFLKDAEDKLIKRLLMEEAEKKSSVQEKEIEVSFGVFVNSKSLVRDQIHNQASQVLPLASSPTYDEPVFDKNSMHP